MRPSVKIRRYQAGEEAALFGVFYSAVHRGSSGDYSPEQIEAWATWKVDPALWEQRIRRINPFVAVLNERIAAYADLQADGFIEHFFVSGAHLRRGFGTLLMNHILWEARELGLSELTSEVSRTAQRFYETFGFAVVEQREPVVRGVVIPNALMRLELKR